MPSGSGRPSKLWRKQLPIREVCSLIGCFVGSPTEAGYREAVVAAEALWKLKASNRSSIAGVFKGT